jgi:hypothetical protein
MKNRIASSLLVLLLLVSSSVLADVGKFKFGILRLKSNGDYVMDVETTRIPLMLKDTGFRFGISFENSGGEMIEWYEVVQLPRPLKQVGGDLVQVDRNVLQSATLASNDKKIVDQFWFDEGDPLGRHRMQIFVNGVLEYQVDFEVVEPRKDKQ